MRPEQLKQEINQLNLSEKIRLVEDVWNSIAENQENLPMPDWHKHELDKRLQTYQSGDAQLIDWNTIHKELKAK